MELLIVRHGIAQDRGAPGVRRDDDRVLTDMGRLYTTLAARGLRTLGCKPGHIGTSPLPRADETARIMAEVLAPDITVQKCSFMQPGGDVRDLVKWLGNRDEKSVMIVGHMPDLAETVVALLTGHGDFDMQFRKAAACCLQFDEKPTAGTASLLWLMQPKQLRALANE
ncbi:MAG: phosphohistidine phosphatase SixA [Phycisphaerae bacterium]|nr:phosphohistidine phosphatase SixA [Phycisphaerae bacterium]